MAEDYLKSNADGSISRVVNGKEYVVNQNDSRYSKYYKLCNNNVKGYDDSKRNIK